MRNALKVELKSILSIISLIIVCAMLLIFAVPVRADDAGEAADSGEAEYDGWFKEDGYWYYRDQDGEQLYGWQDIDGYTYYLMPDSGRLAADCWVLDDDGFPAYLGGDGRHIYWGLSWIGDSMTANWYPSHALEKCFHTPYVAARALKCPYEDIEGNPSGLTVAKGMVMAGMMTDTLVFELGSNNDWHTPELTYADKISMLLDIVGNDTKLILVTCYTVDDETTEDYYGDLNREMRELAVNNENIALADWAAVCDPETDLNPTDGLHLKTEEAAMKYMKLIQSALLENFGPKW